MNKFPLLFFVLLLAGYSFLFDPPMAPAQGNYETTAPILDSAETFFISLKKRNFGTVWDLLSAESHKTIINDIYKASKKSGENLHKEAIARDFDAKGELFTTFWDAFLREFDPEMALEHSRWEMGFIKKNKAEIIILYKKADRPAKLKMFKENGGWKVGFSETFGTRKF
jgi:hypothetical protein